MPLFNKDTGNLVYIVPHHDINQSQAQGRGGQAQVSTFDSGSALVLTATENFSKTETATVTNFPVSSNQNQGDHYRVNGATINFKGVISAQTLNLFNLITGVPEVPLTSYITRVRETMRMLVKGDTNRSPLVRIHLPDGNTEQNCLITSFKISRDAKTSNGYVVEVTAKQLLIADAGFSILPSDERHESKQQTGGNAGVEVDPQGNSVIAQRLKVLNNTPANGVP